MLLLARQNSGPVRGWETSDVSSQDTLKKTTIAGALHYDTMTKSQTVKLNPIDPRDDLSLMAVTQCAQGQSKSY